MEIKTSTIKVEFSLIIFNIHPHTMKNISVPSEAESTSIIVDDELDGGLTLTIDSAGRRFHDSSPVPIHSCINIATPQTDVHNDTCWRCLGVSKKAMLQRLSVVAAGVLVVVVIILIERYVGAEIFDEKKLMQDIADSLVPKILSGRTIAPTTKAE